ncbi:MAG: cell wall-binding repeat-containing protein, partial [Mobilicoccus sp.]|nr:cell wall-binding repeat-containing protein [Mobilicoccus sp.]
MTTRLSRVLASAALVGVAFGSTPALAAETPTEPLRAVVSTTTTADVDVARLSDPVENLAVVAPTRLAGADRFGTAVEISKRAFTPASTRTVYLAGASSTDVALAGGALTDGPVLLVPTTGTVPASVRAEIARLAPTQVMALGGERSVSSAVLAQAAGGRSSARLGSDDVFATATAIARRAFPNGPTRVYLARVGGSPDALVGGSLSDGPVLPVPATGAVPNVVRSYIGGASPRQVVALGGPAAISDAVLSASAVNGSTARLAGADRYETSAAVAHAAFPGGSPVAYLASGASYADAVVGGALTDGPILLSPPMVHPQLTSTVGNALTRLGVSNVGTLGGPVALPDAAVRAVAANAPAVSIGVLPAYTPSGAPTAPRRDPVPAPAPV